MKAMKNVAEFQQAPPPGRYPARIIGAQPEVSKKSSASMLHLTVEILAPAQFAGAQADDYIITDGTAKGAGMGKQKLRALGVNVDTDEDVPDAAIASSLLNLQLEVEFGNEGRMTRSTEDGPFDTAMTVIDQRTGQTVVLQKLTVKNYFRHAVTAQQAPVQQLAPQQFQQAPQYAQQPQQFAPQQFQQPVQQLAPQYAQQQQLAPQGYPVQQGFPVQAGFPQQGGVAVPPWAQAPANGAGGPPAPAETPAGGKKKKGVQIQDV